MDPGHQRKSDGAAAAGSRWPPAPGGVASPKVLTTELVSRGAPPSAVSVGLCDGFVPILDEPPQGPGCQLSFPFELSQFFHSNTEGP